MLFARMRVGKSGFTRSDHEPDIQNFNGVGGVSDVERVSTGTFFLVIGLLRVFPFLFLFLFLDILSLFNYI